VDHRDRLQRPHVEEGAAAAFVQAFIPLIVFFALQRYFVRGILAGSVKG
jgi:alpha-glucoside transport system permease protein